MSVTPATSRLRLVDDRPPDVADLLALVEAALDRVERLEQLHGVEHGERRAPLVP